MNTKSSRRSLLQVTTVLVLGGLLFLIWHFAIRPRIGERSFESMAFNWRNSGQKTVIPGYDLGASEILSANAKVAFAIFTDFSGVTIAMDRQPRREGVLETADGRCRLTWQVKTRDGKSGSLVLNGEVYDLSKGSLFLVATHGGSTRIRQLDKDLSFIELKLPFTMVYESVTDMIRSDPDVTEFFKAEPVPSSRIYFLTLRLPRCVKGAGGKWSPSHEELYQAVKDLPCFARGYFDLKRKSLTAINHNTVDYGTHLEFSFPFEPSEESDLGDVAKALAKLGGDPTKPVARLNFATSVAIAGTGVEAEEAKFAALKKALADAKGIDWERSNRVEGLALAESGGARILEIRAAYEKAGIAIGDAFDKE